MLLKEICGLNDPELTSDMIEAETNIDGFVGRVVQIIQEDEAHCEGIRDYQRRLGDRRKRLQERSRRLRTLLASVVTELPGRFYRHSLAHVRAFDVEAHVVITDESAIPSVFWVPQDPKLDEVAVRRHLLQRAKLTAQLATIACEEQRRSRSARIEQEYPEIAGACLGNPEISIRIRSA